MAINAQTVCETCLTPVAWADLELVGFGASGPCPACGELIVRPRRRPVAHDGSRPELPTMRDAS
jgi:endogenous inhibitor of DNA gyrase (YacG/DUF329 family)